MAHPSIHPIAITAEQFAQIDKLVKSADVSEDALDFSITHWDDERSWVRVVAYPTTEDDEVSADEFEYFCDQFNELMIEIAKVLGRDTEFGRGIDWNCDPFLSSPFVVTEE
jgi:DUF4097 and DUF4098 domain-containing protein YvlB